MPLESGAFGESTLDEVHITGDNISIECLACYICGIKQTELIKRIHRQKLSSLHFLTAIIFLVCYYSVFGRQRIIESALEGVFVYTQISHGSPRRDQIMTTSCNKPVPSQETVVNVDHSFIRNKGYDHLVTRRGV
jgi:hypothetical protein